MAADLAKTVRRESKLQREADLDVRKKARDENKEAKLQAKADQKRIRDSEAQSKADNRAKVQAERADAKSKSKSSKSRRAAASASAWCLNPLCSHRSSGEFKDDKFCPRCNVWCCGYDECNALMIVHNEQCNR